MYLRYFAVCLLLNRVQAESYISSVNEGGRPILRAGLDEIAAYASSLQPSAENVEPLWVADLRSRIRRIVSRTGYEGAKPLIKKAVDETQKKQAVLLDVKGESEVKFEYQPKYVLRTSLLSTGTATDPEWVVGLKLFLKNLIERYGKKKLDAHLRPVIENLENMHHVKIVDIDGDVTVKYKQLKRKRTRTPYGNRFVRERVTAAMYED